MDLSTISFYEENSEFFIRKYDSAKVEDLHCILKRHLPPMGRVLEIGCGSGRDARYLASLGYEVVATDAVDGMVRATAGKLSAYPASKAVQCSFPLPEASTVLSGRFDAVIATALIMHLDDDKLKLLSKQVWSMLNHGGIFVVSSSEGRQGLDHACYDEHGRLFIERHVDQIKDTLALDGFHLFVRVSTADSLGRDAIQWHTLIFSGPRD